MQTTQQETKNNNIYKKGLITGVLARYADHDSNVTAVLLLVTVHIL